MSINATNLCVLKKTRKKPTTGDIFVFKIEQFPDRFFFGRVIATDTSIGGHSDFHPVLIYLYKSTSNDKASIPQLNTVDLLLPPIGTNLQPWSQGVFETVTSRPITKSDLLPQHCFKDVRGYFFDEYSNRLQDASEPVGVYGVSGTGSIDVKISKALGVPLK